MGHLLKLKCAHSSTILKPMQMLMPDVVLVEVKRITVYQHQARSNKLFWKIGQNNRTQLKTYAVLARVSPKVFLDFRRNTEFFGTIHGIPRHFDCEISRISVKCSGIPCMFAYGFPYVLYFRSYPDPPLGLKNIINNLYNMDKEAWAAPGCVYTTKAFTAPGRVYTTCMGLICTWTWLHIEPLLILDVLYTYRGMCCTWTCQQNRGLHVDVSGQQEPVLVLTCLYHKGLSSTCTCLFSGAFGAPGRVYTTGARAEPGLSTVGRVYTTEAFAASRRVHTTEAFAGSGRVYTTEAFAAPGRVYHRDLCCPPGRVCITEAFAAPGHVYITETFCCTWTCLHHRGLCCPWMCL